MPPSAGVLCRTRRSSLSIPGSRISAEIISGPGWTTILKSPDAHNLKFGVYIERSAVNEVIGSWLFNGTFAFDRDPNNPTDTGYAFSNRASRQRWIATPRRTGCLRDMFAT